MLMAQWDKGVGERMSLLWIGTNFFMPDNHDQADLSIDQFDLLLAEAIEKGLICFDLTTKTFSRGPNFPKCPKQDAQPS
jgi:hypothetical protein